MEDSTLSRFLIFSFILIFSLADAGQLCGSCSYLVQPSDCYVVTRCGDHEECVVEQYVTPLGLTRYDIGCEPTFRCHGTGKREENSVLDLSDKSLDNRSPLCKACCNNTEMCNIIGGLCNSPVLNTNGALLCYNCEQMDGPDQCDRITQCGIDNQCYVGRKKNELSGRYLWESRCGENSTECLTLMRNSGFLFGKRQISHLCATCCNKEHLCNNECNPPSLPPVQTHPTTQPPPPTSTKPTTVYIPPPTTTTTSRRTTQSTTVRRTTRASTTTASTTSALSKPVITYVTRLYDVKQGSFIHLKCTAIGNPTPTVAWSFFAPLSVVPNNLRVTNGGADIYVDNVRTDNYGHYACRANNSLGIDVRYVDILEVGPPHTP